ncbi:unnamed protein product [Trichobilharzia regenti]|nr:unnamed protein product [Trichobilharzia regenti]
MNNRRHHHHHHYNNSYHYTERRVGSPIISPSSLSSTSKERVIQWLRDQQLYLSQLIH